MKILLAKMLKVFQSIQFKVIQIYAIVYVILGDFGYTVSQIWFLFHWPDFVVVVVYSLCK